MLGACAKAPSLAFARVPRLSSGDADCPTCQDPARHHPVRGDAGHEPRAPSIGSILDLAAERRSSRSLLRFATSSSHPFARSVRFRPSSSGTGRRSVLPRVSLVCLAAPLGGFAEDASHRLLQPTHDTSTRGSLDFRARGLRRTDHRVLPAEAVLPGGAGPPCGNPAPADPRLTARSSASALRAPTIRADPSSLEERGGGDPFRGPRPAGAFSSPAELRERPLTSPVAPRGFPVTRRPSWSQSRFHRPLVNEDGFPDPRRLPSTDAPWGALSRFPISV
jgi:hypothetical protein